MEEIKAWAGVVAALIAIGTAIYTWLTAGSKKAQADVDALRIQIDDRISAMRADAARDHEKIEEARNKHGEVIVARFHLVEARLLKMESDLTHLPDREQTHRLELAVERLTGRMETLDERLKPVAAVSDRLQEFLLEQAARK